MKLYEITRQLQDTWAQAEALIDTPDITDEQRDALLVQLGASLTQIEGTRTDKCINVACLIKNVEAEQAAVEAEEKKLKARRQRAEKNAEWLRAYLASNMEAGIPIKDARVVISWRKSTSVEVEVQPEQLPEAFRRTKVIVEADKTALKDALKTGQEVAGVKLVEKQNIQIK